MGTLARTIGQECVAQTTKVIDDMVVRYGELIGMAAACAVFGVAERSVRHRVKQRRDKATHDAHHQRERANDAPSQDATPAPSPCRFCRAEHGQTPPKRRWRFHPSTLTLQEREQILAILCSDRFKDTPAEQAYWTLLDEGEYYCSARTMYRILAAHYASSDRRRGRHHTKGAYAVPRLRATRRNQVWSWDVSLLPTLTKGIFVYLYAVIDVYSRKIVGWMVADCESKENAEKLIRETCHREKVEQHQLTIHADRGAIMKAKNVGDLFAKLGVTRSHSRPRVSNDNPFSESLFKTFKYRHDYPLCFASLRAARRWVAKFVQWYNHEHHHSGIAYFHPNQVHDGTWIETHERRQAALHCAYEQHPERFRKPPKADEPPTEVWINRPPEDDAPTAEQSQKSTTEVVPV
jgi:putative transposase